MISAMFAYAFPFILIALLFILWAWSGYKLRFKYPKYYEFNLKVFNNFPKILPYIIVLVLIYLFFTTDSYYD